MNEKLDVLRAEVGILTIKEIEGELRKIGYSLAGITGASEYPEDRYLLYVIGRKDHGLNQFTYTSWIYNTKTRCMNLGHYGFSSHVLCLLDVLKNRINYMNQEEI
ncbi:MAG: hypothetical protein ACLSVX_12385 [Massilimicrobiota timonensis]